MLAKFTLNIEPIKRSRHDTGEFEIAGAYYLAIAAKLQTHLTETLQREGEYKVLIGQPFSTENLGKITIECPNTANGIFVYCPNTLTEKVRAAISSFKQKPESKVRTVTEETLTGV